MLSRSLMSGALALALAGAAQAGTFDQNIFLSFVDPAGQREVTYTAPITAADDGRLSYNSQIPIALQIDLSDFGIAAPLVIQSTLRLEVNVGAAGPGGQPDEFVAATDGTFLFTRLSDSAPLIEGVFDDARVSILRTSGGLTANGLIGGGNFDISFTPAFITALAGAGFNFPGFDPEREADASWTLTGVTPRVSLVTPPGGSEEFFADFRANAAFTGTIPVIPTPGAVGLAFAAGLLTIGVRRR